MPTYRAFGLTVESALPWPHATPAPAEATPDVTIAEGPVPTSLPHVVGRGLLFEVGPDDLLLSVPNVARYHVTPGRITVEAAPAADEASVRLFLLESGMVALLHARGTLPLSATTLAPPQHDHAVALVGASRIGKSAFAMALVQRGWRVLSDTISAVHVTPDGTIMVQPGLPQLLLWEDMMAYFGLPTDAHARVRPQLAKYAVPLAPHQRHDAPLPLKAAYLLAPRTTDQVSLEPIRGVQKFTALKWQVLFSLFVEGRPYPYAHTLLHLAARLPLQRLVMTDKVNVMQAMIDTLNADQQVAPV